MNKWLSSTEVRASPIHGLGRFSCEMIPKGEPVLIIMGSIIPNGPGNTRIPIRGTGFVIDCEQTFVNHSRAPNLYLDGQILFRSLREIVPGEELTIDYTTLTSSRLGFEEEGHAL